MNSYDQSDNFDDVRKNQKKTEYQTLLREAQSEESLYTEPTFEAARLYLKAQAVAVAHFREFGDRSDADAYPGDSTTSETNYLPSPTDVPVGSLSGPLEDDLYEFLHRTYPGYRKYWVEFLKDGTIKSALGWQLHSHS